MFPWLTNDLIKTYLPAMRYSFSHNKKLIPVWNRKEAISICKTNEVLVQECKKYKQLKQNMLDLRLEYQAFVSRFTPREKFLYAQQLDRHFVLHIGPTNSGKTYTALKALKEAGCGVYLGPLRLMALEVFDKLNDAGISCSLLTGEESIPLPLSKFTASTVEMADFQTHYDVAVIDEAQMISDSRRGSHWFDAICRIDAETVHICLAPEAEQIIIDIMESLNAPYEVVYHERLTPLIVGKQLTGFEDVLPGDAVIAFSREKVLKIAAELKSRGFAPAIIYGGLPPKSRRMEVEAYNTGQKDIIVATDAIGMGLSLPIRRVVFAELRKFDGKCRRMLRPAEVIQIAGRAGRYGIYERGEVTSLYNTQFIAAALQRKIPDVNKVRIPFPGDDAVASEHPLKELIVEWQRLPREGWYYREDMGNALKLLEIFPGKLRKTDKSTIYRLIMCPFDAEKKFLAEYWTKCARAILDGQEIPVPNYGMNSLMACEQQYKALDLYKILCVRFDRENHCENFQEEVIRQIAVLLQNQGNQPAETVDEI